MRLRGQRVLARCDERGELLVEAGRVEIRYKPHDGRAYRASARNLEPGSPDVLPDSHCAPADAAAPRTAKRTARQAADTSHMPTEPSPGETLAYADGACSGNPGPAGVGVVLLVDGRRRELSEYLGNATNNVAELTGILRAAEECDPSKPLSLYTDSRYAIGVVTGGMRAKKNQALIAAVQAALRRLERYSLHHVPGHAGVELNERADELAVQAVRDRDSTGWQDA